MIDIVVPEVGEVGMELTFVMWLKDPGDKVTEGEPLFQLDTQKTLLDVEAVGTGFLDSVVVGPGDLVQPRQIIARLRLRGDDDNPASPPEEPVDHVARLDPPTVDSTPPTSERPVGRARISPRARRRAAELGVDTSELEGTGIDGLITLDDVDAAAGGASETATQSTADDDRVERTRRAVAALTSGSWRTVPHFYLTLDADLSAGLQLARPMVLICAAIARALREHPECNLQWAGDTLVRRSSVDLGILVDTPAGLILPTVRDADSLDSAGLTAAIRSAADRAKRGLLQADDFGARSLSVSNLGMYAVDQFDGVIASPDPMLLTIGRAHAEPSWNGEIWVPRTVARLTLAVDHRALDGANAARLLTTLEGLLIEPGWIA